jgi:pimeloyl-ACP methyl ester carboxylesterase/uncharacterized protein (DUF2141 family)
MTIARSLQVTVLMLLAAAVASCSTILAVKDQQRRADTTAVIAGTVATERPARGPLVVALFARAGDDWALVDYFTAEQAGPWVFGVQPGTYWIAAFEDVNSDGAYQDEPFFRSDPARPVVLAPGQRVTDVALVIPEEGRALQSGRVALADLEARSSEEQRAKSLYAVSALGKVTTLDDPRFAPPMGEQGMWQFYDFILKAGAGIYFLEPYDPARIPVLFIHGIAGTPRDFTALVAALDRKRFQPWVVYYPTGARLDVTVMWLDQLFSRLQIELGVERAVVVAHSMGGLVARGFVLRHDAADARHVLRTFVTISSPLGGMASAGAGVEDSPIVVRSWYGLAPGSDYLEGLYYADPKTRRQRRRLPDTIPYHMLFGFKGGGRSGSSDGTVMLSSQLRPEAQEEARTIRGFDEDHMGILASPTVAAHLGGILATVR